MPIATVLLRLGRPVKEDDCKGYLLLILLILLILLVVLTLPFFAACHPLSKNSYFRTILHSVVSCYFSPMVQFRVCTVTNGVIF